MICKINNKKANAKQRLFYYLNNKVLGDLIHRLCLCGGSGSYFGTKNMNGTYTYGDADMS